MGFFNAVKPSTSGKILPVSTEGMLGQRNLSTRM
jgi:hypothetical protein